jgi:hypothetical protein
MYMWVLITRGFARARARTHTHLLYEQARRQLGMNQELWEAAGGNEMARVLELLHQVLCLPR